MIEIEPNAERRGRVQGMIEGEIKGKIETAKLFINKYLQAQFGDASMNLQKRIEQYTELEALEQIIDKLFQVKQLSEAELLIETHLQYSR